MTTAFEHCPIDTPILVNGEQVGYWEMVSYCNPFNLTGGIQLLCFRWRRIAIMLPIGIQIVGRRWGDERLLAIAQTLSQLTKGTSDRRGIEVTARSDSTPRIVRLSI